ncbi:hypothetical protein EIP86_011572 [Pleurotus ostreatoroseus]|nr:hypothetical protein EIP86_011572 [Pleurotus ostreatoroseus]
MACKDAHQESWEVLCHTSYSHARYDERRARRPDEPRYPFSHTTSTPVSYNHFLILPAHRSKDDSYVLLLRFGLGRSADDGDGGDVGLDSCVCVWRGGSAGCVGTIGGNQRELARAKNAKKTQAATKGKQKESAASLQQRREQDAAILREKQKKKEEEKAAATAAAAKK